MCSLEIVITSLWVSEIIPRYAVENSNHCTVILKLSVKISVGWCYLLGAIGTQTSLSESHWHPVKLKI